MQLLLTDYDKGLMIQVLSDHGKKLLNKKLSPEENKELSSIENIIQQLAFGKNDSTDNHNKILAAYERVLNEVDQVNNKADDLVNKYQEGS